VDTETRSDCPKNTNHHLERHVSFFAAITGKNRETDSDDDLPPIDESKMEKAMQMLASEADRIDEDNPREAARLMRKLSDMTGLQMGPGMEEALSRLEKGEDPEKIEEEMGDLLEEEDPFVLEKKSKTVSKKFKPKVDDTIYDM